MLIRHRPCLPACRGSPELLPWEWGQQPSWARAVYILKAAAQRLTRGGAEPLLWLEVQQISLLL